MRLFNEETMTTTETAKAVGVCVQTIKAWIKNGQLKAWRVGNRYQIPVSALETIAKPVNQ